MEVLILTFLIFMMSMISLEISLIFLLNVFFYSILMNLEGLYSMEMLIDNLSSPMICLSFFLWIFILISSFKSSKEMGILISFLFFVIILFFLTTNLFIFFLTFEVSLIPLLIMMLLFGRQMERIKATQFLLLYTMIASSPLLIFILFFSKFESSSMLINSFLFSNNTHWIAFFSIFSFLVKIPIFFFHSWLLKAHVEAPLEGSMILAGVMLKVGIYGLIRIFMMMNFPNWLVMLIFSISIMGSIISAMMALSSDDMKMSVAFSSVSHMNFIIPSLLTMKMEGMTSSIIIMFSHGISSPFLFFYVTKIYNYSNSRSVLISKGLAAKLPLLSFVGLVLWSINLSTPPFFAFLGELMILSSIFSFFSSSWMILVVFILLNSFFSILNYGIQSHSSMKLNLKMKYFDMMFTLMSIQVLMWMILLFFFQI